MKKLFLIAMMIILLAELVSADWGCSNQLILLSCSEDDCVVDGPCQGTCNTFCNGECTVGPSYWVAQPTWTTENEPEGECVCACLDTCEASGYDCKYEAICLAEGGSEFDEGSLNEACEGEQICCDIGEGPEFSSYGIIAAIVIIALIVIWYLYKKKK